MDGVHPGRGFPPDTGDSASREAALVDRLLRCAQLLERRLAETYSREGLNPARVAVLEAVIPCGADGCSQADLAASLGLSESNVCTLAERMQADGWLLRVRSSDDRRKCILLGSPQGRAAVDRIARIRSNACELWLQSLQPDELQHAARLLDRLLELIGAIPESRTPGTVPRREQTRTAGPPPADRPAPEEWRRRAS